MKKLNALFVLLAMSAGVFAQGPFTIVNWVSLASDGTYNYDFNATPYAKAEATALKAKANVVVDMAAIDELGIQDLWTSLGNWGSNPNLVGINTNNAGGDPYDLDANGDGTYGLSWKAFYDADNLYILIKYVDANNFTVGSAGTDTRAIEISFQGKEKDRFEAGYTAAADVYGATGKNAQYGRYVELGGGKAKWSAAGVTECVSTVGQTGGWGSSIGAANTPDQVWNLTQDNTAWGIVALNFADYMMYLDDEWGASEASNEIAFDPTAKPTIAFDVKSDAVVGATDLNTEYWWSSNDNNGYCLIYFNGYLNFSTDEFPNLGVEKYMKAADKSAFIYDNILKFKGYNAPVNVEIYSVVGQKVKSATNVNTLSVADLNKGVYMVKVGNDVFKVMK